MVYRVARGGANWIVTPLAIAIVMAGVPIPSAPWLVPLSMIPFSLTLFFLLFFRDPERRVSPGIASPADGKVVRVDRVNDPDIGEADRLSIFMSPTNVHVNRAPLDGDVRSVTHRPGKHVPAFNKDSDRNERVETIFATQYGDIKVIQIAGAVARRIVPYAQPGDHLEKGGRMGLIRLGSRCDVLIPVGTVVWTAKLGDRVHAGSSQIGDEVDA